MIKQAEKLWNKIFSNFYWDCCESFDVFINKQNKIVGIIDMYATHPIKYFFMNLFYTRTSNINASKQDYIRLYPKESKNIQFIEDKIKSSFEEKNTTKYALEHGYKFEQF